MHIALFTALKSVNVADDKATEVVEAFEEYVAVNVKDANSGLEAQLKGANAALEAQLKGANAALEAQLKGLEAQQKALTWLIGSLGSVIAIGVLVSALSPIITKLIH